MEKTDRKVLEILENINFEVACKNCHHKFKYGSGDIVIECGFEGVRCPKCGNWIYHNNDNTSNNLSLWIARNKSGALFLYGEKPIKVEEWGEFAYVSGRYIHLSHKLFPDVTWENSPQKVKIELLKR